MSTHTDKVSFVDENNRLAVKQVSTFNKRVVVTMVFVNMSSNGINPKSQRLQHSDLQSQPRNITPKVSYLISFCQR